MINKDLFNKTIFDMKAVIDIPVGFSFERYGTPEYWKRLENELKREIDNLEKFIRDHRSRDSYGISVEKQYVLLCKFCGYAYPEDFDGIADCCEEMLKAQGISSIEYEQNQ